MIVSYAQNFEDIMIQRSFPDIRDGFYIDIGAWDPVKHSVTKLFYDRGWRGINIEPNKEYYNKLCVSRERDINLNIGIGEKAETLTFKRYIDPDLSNLSTFHELPIEAPYETEEIQIMSLADLCEKYVPQGQEITFMKIDAEGSERELLLSANFIKYRPKLIIIESTFPNSSIPCEEQWIDIFEKNDYIKVYFDGLNSFFLSAENIELRQYFSYPPSVHDRFVTHDTFILNNLLNDISTIISKYKSY